MASKQDSGTKGRKPLPAAAIEGDVMDGEALAERSQQLAVMGEVQAAYGAERDLVNQLLGQAQAAGAFEQFSRTVRISKLAHVKENKLYRDIAGMKLRTGAEKLAGTWEEFCGLLGQSVDQVDRDIANLRAFGEEALEAMTRAGIGYRELRELRREGLPDEDRATLIELAKAGDQEKLIDAAEDLIARQRVQRNRLQAAQDQLEADNSTRAKELSQAREQLDAAKSKAALLPRMKADKKADYMLAELEKAFAEARTANRNVAQACATFLDYTSDNALDFDQDVSARTVELDNLLLALVMDLRLRGINQPLENALAVLGGV